MGGRGVLCRQLKQVMVEPKLSGKSPVGSWLLTCLPAPEIRVEKRLSLSSPRHAMPPHLVHKAGLSCWKKLLPAGIHRREAARRIVGGKGHPCGFPWQPGADKSERLFKVRVLVKASPWRLGSLVKHLLMGERCKLGFSLSRSGFDPDLQLLLRFCGTGFWVFLLTQRVSVWWTWELSVSW